MTSKLFTPLAFTPWVAEAIQQSDSHFLVTGAGGWLGHATLEMLESALGDNFRKRVHAFGSQGRMQQLRSGNTIAVRPLSFVTQLNVKPCLILHYAFLGREKTADRPLADFIKQNELISDTVFAAAQTLEAKGIFVPSSGAVYRSDRSIDTDMERNPYGVMKARDEERFFTLRDKMRVVCSRVFNLGGPFINKVQTYALSAILLDLLHERPITLSADKPVIRSYIHVRDIIDLAMALLLSDAPLPRAAFDTAGEEEIEIGELAKRAAVLLGKPDWPIHRPAITGEANRYVGDGTVIHSLMQQQIIEPLPLDRQITDTLQYCRKIS